MVFYDNASLMGLPAWALMVILIWSLTWKGLALWKSAKRNSPIWFIVLLVVNTLGILEILYIFLFSKIDLNTFKRKSPKKKSSRKRV